MATQLTEQDLATLDTLLHEKHDRTAFYLHYYELTGNSAVLDMAKISHLSSFVGGVAQRANDLIEALHGDLYPKGAVQLGEFPTGGVKVFSEMVAESLFQEVERSHSNGGSGALSKMEVLEAARDAWEQNNLGNQFPGNPLLAVERLTTIPTREEALERLAESHSLNPAATALEASGALQPLFSEGTLVSMVSTLSQACLSNADAREKFEARIANDSYNVTEDGAVGFYVDRETGRLDAVIDHPVLGTHIPGKAEWAGGVHYAPPTLPVAEHRGVLNALADHHPDLTHGKPAADSSKDASGAAFDWGNADTNALVRQQIDQVRLENALNFAVFALYAQTTRDHSPSTPASGLDSTGADLSFTAHREPPTSILGSELYQPAMIQTDVKPELVGDLLPTGSPVVDAVERIADIVSPILNTPIDGIGPKIESYISQHLPDEKGTLESPSTSGEIIIDNTSEPHSGAPKNTVLDNTAAATLSDEYATYSPQTVLESSAPRAAFEVQATEGVLATPEHLGVQGAQLPNLEPTSVHAAGASSPTVSISDISLEPSSKGASQTVVAGPDLITAPVEDNWVERPDYVDPVTVQIGIDQQVAAINLGVGGGSYSGIDTAPSSPLGPQAVQIADAQFQPADLSATSATEARPPALPPEYNYADLTVKTAEQPATQVHDTDLSQVATSGVDVAPQPPTDAKVVDSYAPPPLPESQTVRLSDIQFQPADLSATPAAAAGQPALLPEYNYADLTFKEAESPSTQVHYVDLSPTTGVNAVADPSPRTDEPKSWVASLFTPESAAPEPTSHIDSVHLARSEPTIPAVDSAPAVDSGPSWQERVAPPPSEPVVESVPPADPSPRPDHDNWATHVSDNSHDSSQSQGQNAGGGMGI